MVKREYWNTRIASVAALIGLSIAAAAPRPGYADPPPWAPAYGWRAKHDPYYTGYFGRKWERDYDVLEGRCNRRAVGAVLGGAVGGAIGSTVGHGDGRKIATIMGTVIGAVAGAQLARGIDDEDRACIGHTLELVEPERTVMWHNPTTGLTYRVTPLANFVSNGMSCREFAAAAGTDGRPEVLRMRACRTGDGVWRLVNGARILQVRHEDD